MKSWLLWIFPLQQKDFTVIHIVSTSRYFFYLSSSSSSLYSMYLSYIMEISLELCSEKRARLPGATTHLPFLLKHFIFAVCFCCCHCFSYHRNLYSILSLSWLCYVSSRLSRYNSSTTHHSPSTFNACMYESSIVFLYAHHISLSFFSVNLNESWFVFLSIVFLLLFCILFFASCKKSKLQVLLHFISSLEFVDKYTCCAEKSQKPSRHGWKRVMEFSQVHVFQIIKWSNEFSFDLNIYVPIFKYASLTCATFILTVTWIFSLL